MAPSLELYKHLSLITSFLSISLGFFFVFIKSKHNRSNVFLGILILLYSLYFLPGFFDALNILDDLPHVIRLNFFSGILIGPFTYLYCKSSIEAEPLTFKKIRLHLVPAVIGFFYYLPMLAKSGAEKMEVYHSIMVTGFTPSPIWISLGIGLIAVTYTVLSIRMIIRYLNHLKKTRSSIDPSFHRWLLFLSSTLLIPIVITVITRLVGATTLPFPVVVFALSLLIFIIYGTFLLQPKFFDKFQYQIDDQEIEEVNSIEKYQNSNLQNNQKSEYLEKIIKYMDSEKPYLDPELTILQFSNTVDIPTYYVSQIINEQLECNFIDFVNRYRIDEIKVKLEDPKLNHFKILNLAYDSGFNSKTAFYYAFKKHVDMTPGAYRKENQLSTA